LLILYQKSFTPLSPCLAAKKEYPFNEQIRINQLPVSATRWQHESQIYSAKKSQNSKLNNEINLISRKKYAKLLDSWIF
jgi:hypothetical protein